MINNHVKFHVLKIGWTEMINFLNHLRSSMLLLIRETSSYSMNVRNAYMRSLQLWQD